MWNMFQKIFMVSLLFLVLAGSPIMAQGHPGGHCDPDSLILITVSGYAMVDTSHMFPAYFLDEDGDDIAEYFLDFGPPWYEPDSGNASRPNDGDTITVYGGIHDSLTTSQGLAILVVYEINGEFWRDPFAPFWLGPPGHHPFTGHGWLGFHRLLQTISVSGYALVDTTFIFHKYYLDVDQDTVPDYFLNFGPPWYEPSSGATRPENGDAIDIVGGLFQPDSLMPMIVVYEINGLTWRDSTILGLHLGGGWIKRHMTQAKYVHTPWDSSCGFRIQAGWHPGGLPGMMLPDSIFCHMQQLFPQNMPQFQNQHIFAGFEVGMFGPNGFNLLMGHMIGQNALMFNNQVQYRFHYNDVQLQGFNIDENTIQLKSWDNSSGSWIVETDAQLNTADNTVTLTSQEIDRYYILTGDEVVVNLDNEETLLADGFMLEQNYPNPFNPSTTINFTLSETGQVELILYNVLGQKIMVLMQDASMPAGSHQFVFEAGTLPSGIYFYELKVDGVSKVRRMNLLR